MRKILFLLVLISFFSCEKEATPPTKNELHISFHSFPSTFDPRKSGDLIASSLLFMIFRGLTQQGDDGKVLPDLAHSYTISKDKKIYTFHLRDALWSDGKKITAYDFEKSWKKVIDPSFPSLCPQLFYCIKNARAIAIKEKSVDDLGIQAKDEKTFIVELEQPTPYFLALTSFCVFFPIPSHIEEKDPFWDQKINGNFVSNGPYNLISVKQNNKIVIEKNTQFWQAKEISIEKINIYIVDNENTALQMFENKQLDCVGSPLSPIPNDAITFVSKKKEFSTSPIAGTAFCSFNVTKGPLQNKNLRKALSYAMNKSSIVKNISQKKELIATRCIPPVIALENKNLIEDNNPYLAKKHFLIALKELNLNSEDLNLTFIVGTKHSQRKIAEALCDQWKKTLGINVKIKPTEDKTLHMQLYKHHFDIALFYLIMQYNDPMNIFERFMYKDHPKNYSGWEDPKFINLIKRSINESDTEKRNIIIEEIEKYFMDELPICPIFHLNYAMLIHNHIIKLPIGALGGVYFERAKIKNK